MNKPYINDEDGKVLTLSDGTPARTGLTVVVLNGITSGNKEGTITRILKYRFSNRINCLMIENDKIANGYFIEVAYDLRKATRSETTKFNRALKDANINLNSIL